MARVQGVEAIAKALQHRADAVGADGKYSVIVGFTAARLEMLPSNPVDDLEDGRMSDSELASQSCAAALCTVEDVAAANLSYLLRGQLGEVLPLPFDSATFSEAVVVVVGGGSGEEVGRVHAGRVVAVVADEQAVRDGAEVNLPREAMGFEQLPLNGKCSVLSAEHRPCPDPALAVNRVCGAVPVDELPESFGVRRELWRVGRPGSLQPHVVCAAQSTSEHCSGAAFNRTWNEVVDTRHDRYSLGIALCDGARQAGREPAFRELT